MNITDLLDFTAERLGEDYNRAYGMQPSPWTVESGSDLDRGPGRRRSAIRDATGEVLAVGLYAAELADANPEWQLRSIASRLAIVRTIREAVAMPAGVGTVATDVARLLAWPYAAHADYRQEWAPPTAPALDSQGGGHDRYAPDPAEQQPDPVPSPADQVAAAAESIAQAASGLATAVEQFSAAWGQKR